MMVSRVIEHMARKGFETKIHHTKKAVVVSVIDPNGTPDVGKIAVYRDGSIDGEGGSSLLAFYVMNVVQDLRTPQGHAGGASRGVADVLDERRRHAEEGPWIPASGGTEPVFRSRSGRRLQYLYQPSTGRHAYYDVDNDVILSNEDAWAHLGR